MMLERLKVGGEGEDRDEMIGWHHQFNGHEFEQVQEVGWRRQWQPTPVLLPGKSHGQSSLVGCSPWGHIESDMTEAT